MPLILLHGGLVKLEKRFRLISTEFLIQNLSVRNYFERMALAIQIIALLDH